MGFHPCRYAARASGPFFDKGRDEIFLSFFFADIPEVFFTAGGNRFSVRPAGRPAGDGETVCGFFFAFDDFDLNFLIGFPDGIPGAVFSFGVA